LLEKLVEDIGADDDGRRHADADAGEPLAYARLVEHEIDERQAARLAAERSPTETVERRLRRERVGVEIDDHAAAASLAVGADGAHQLVPQIADGREVGHLAWPQLVRERELGPRLEPLREVV